MAQKIITEYVDDIDGGAANGTTRFGLDGRDYEIDLSEAHRGELEAALAPFLRAGRRTSGEPSMRRPGTRLARRVHLSQVRVWAREQGYPVNERGRLPDALLQAYADQHG